MPKHKLPKNVCLEKIRSVVQIIMSQTNFTLLIYTISEKCPLKFNGRLLPSSLHSSHHFFFFLYPFRTYILSFLTLIYFTSQK